MALRRTRTRMLDVIVTLVAVCLCASPFLASSHAENSPLIETAITVDERVKQSATISQPLNGTFDVDFNGGQSIGSIDWEVYTSANEGFKLAMSTDGVPAMRDKAGSNNVTDYRPNPAAWAVGANDRRFGFSAKGDQALSAYNEGSKWRGFTGRRPIEVARRRKGPVSMTTTTVRLASEMRRPLPSSARPHSWLIATAMMNI